MVEFRRHLTIGVPSQGDHDIWLSRHQPEHETRTDSLATVSQVARDVYPALFHD